jgi:hypothetical protein
MLITTFATTDPGTFKPWSPPAPGSDPGSGPGDGFQGSDTPIVGGYPPTLIVTPTQGGTGAIAPFGASFSRLFLNSTRSFTNE